MGNGKKKTIVISAINFDSGGPLSVLKDCLAFLGNEFQNSYDIIALVHRKNLFNVEGIRYIEFPNAKKHWGVRLYYEYVYFKKLSAQMKPYLWLSMHDITPNVDAEIRAVYCHNPSPFHKLTFKEAWFEPTFAVFNKLYLFFYKLNIRKNNCVIVQQAWLREQFKTFFPECNIVVAHPEINLPDYPPHTDRKEGTSKTLFFFPSLPRVFKNFEVICEAVKRLCKLDVSNFEVLMTIDGSENRYSKYIVGKYQHLEPLKFIGMQSRRKIYEYYALIDCMIFPSKLETWGLPITEIQRFRKPILVAKSQYSLETLDGYSLANLFDPDDSLGLSVLMHRTIKGKVEYQQIKKNEITYPSAKNWHELFEILLRNELDEV